MVILTLSALSLQLSAIPPVYESTNPPTSCRSDYRLTWILVIFLSALSLQLSAIPPTHQSIFPFLTLSALSLQLSAIPPVYVSTNPPTLPLRLSSDLDFGNFPFSFEPSAFSYSPFPI
jgi:hypothetical protein